MVGNLVTPVDWVSTGPWPHVICCQLSSLTRSAVWHTMTVDKTFYKSTCDSFNRSIAFREDKPISRVSVSSSKNVLPRPWWKWSTVINLPLESWTVINLALESWLITPGNGAIWGLSVLTAARYLGQPSWVKVHLAEPLFNCHPCHRGHMTLGRRARWLERADHV